MLNARIILVQVIKVCKLTQSPFLKLYKLMNSKSLW